MIIKVKAIPRLLTVKGNPRTIQPKSISRVIEA